MVGEKFDYSAADSQGTCVHPIEPEKFDFEKYSEYEMSLLEKNSKFWNAHEGVAVYRRFRVPEVFSYGCKDMNVSFKLQLGALNESMKYRLI